MRLDSRIALLGPSLANERLRSVLPRVAEADSGVLIVGEPGTGREEVARLIHETSPRRAGPFGVTGCPGWQASNEFDELFGGPGCAGLLEECARGTVYLSSVDELPAAAQSRLARFVEDASLGVVRQAPRLLASARHELSRLVGQARFREDLYYRLSVITLRLAPLRERREDIPALSTHLLRECGLALGKRFEGIARDAMQALVGHRWSGNVAELASAIQRAAILEDGPLLTLQSLPPAVQANLRLAVAS